jgi:hypothetical protein
VENQTDSQLFEQIEPHIAYLAAKGRRAWKPVHRSIKLLVSAPPVQSRLGGLDAEARSHPDAEIEAIASVLEAAIKSLPNPYRDAALEHFGFTDKGPGKATLKGARQKKAAEALGLSERLYRKPHEEYCDMEPRHYIIALAACAFCGIADPIAYVDRRGGADAEASPAGTRAEQGSTSADLPDAPTVAGAVIAELASRDATMVSREPGHLEVFWVGPNHVVFYRWWQNEHGWSTDDSWDDPAAVSLTAVSREPGDEVLFGLSPDGRVWYRVWGLDHRGWHTAREAQWLDDEVVRGPMASASRDSGTIELFAFDAEGKPWHRWTEGGMNWSPWTYW